MTFKNDKSTCSVTYKQKSRDVISPNTPWHPDETSSMFKYCDSKAYFDISYDMNHDVDQ